MKIRLLLISVSLLFLGMTSPALAKTTVLFLGDSLTAGYGVEKEEAFPYLFDQALKKRGYQDIRVINAGISGSTSASALSRLKWYLRNKPDILVLALGANDGLRGLDPKEMKKNLKATIQLAQKYKIHVVIAGMKALPNYGLEYTKHFDAIYPSLSKEYNAVLIPFLLEGVAGLPQFNLADGIHPNPQGHQIITKILLKYIPPLLPR